MDPPEALAGPRVLTDLSTVPRPATARLPLSVVRAMRPLQWSKNVLVFVAPAAAGVLDQRANALKALAVFAIFCAVASGVYLCNDVVDAEADRRHPEKCERPVAAGHLSPGAALAVGVALMLVGLPSAWFVARGALVAVVATYAVVSLVYSLRLKREPVLEMAAVASGFVLRAIAGGVAADVRLSRWFLVVTSFGALFLVAGKRVGEQHRLGPDRASHRQVLDRYTPSFLRSILVLSASVTVTTYCLWAFDRGGLAVRAGQHEIWFQLTVVPITLGLLHVLCLIDRGEGSAPEGLVLRDHLLQGLGLVWLALLSIGLYG